MSEIDIYKITARIDGKSYVYFPHIICHLLTKKNIADNQVLGNGFIHNYLTKHFHGEWCESLDIFDGYFTGTIKAFTDEDHHLQNQSTFVIENIKLTREGIEKLERLAYSGYFVNLEESEQIVDFPNTYKIYRRNPATGETGSVIGELTVDYIDLFETPHTAVVEFGSLEGDYCHIKDDPLTTLPYFEFLYEIEE